MTSSPLIISKKLYSPDFKQKYKTELCRNWMSGFCSFENKCVFAHGKSELREKKTLVDCTEDNFSSLASAKKRLPVFIELSKRASNESE
jgi:Zinc finger C-x8-C-x5-C-x3-H type (and similar)